MNDDKQILEAALKVLSEAFDEFITECMDEKGNPKAPDRKALMRARGLLPPAARNAFKKPL